MIGPEDWCDESAADPKAQRHPLSRSTIENTRPQSTETDTKDVWDEVKQLLKMLIMYFGSFCNHILLLM